MTYAINENKLHALLLNQILNDKEIFIKLFNRYQFKLVPTTALI